MKSSATFTKEQQLYKARKKEQRKRKFEQELEKAAEEEKVAKVKDTNENEKAPNFDELKNVRTFSIAIPGSILDNAQSKELRTYLAGQIARTACIYRIDEIIIFYDGCEKQSINREDGISRCCVQFGRILQYLECPQYLRKHIFPIHKDLEYAGLLNPLDAPHHLREEDDSLYREGITTSKASEDGCYVEIGLRRPCHIKEKIIPNVRVTIKLQPKRHEDEKRVKGWVVPPTLPRHESNLYWGYNVRIVNSLNEVFTGCPYGKYDYTVGTSDKGKCLEDVSVPLYKHGLMVFGGLQGLEAALENDESLDVDNVQDLFDEYVNTCPGQGSRTIRTEEAVLISLASFRPHLPV